MTSIAETLIVLAVVPKSTLPSMVAVVPTLAEVATIPASPMVSTPLAPARLAGAALLNVRTRGVPVPPRLLKTRPAWVLLSK